MIERRKFFTFGGVCQETGHRFYRLVRNCKRKTIWNLLKEHVAPGSTLYTDGAEIYKGVDGVKGEAFGLHIWHHSSVNHSAGEYARDEMCPVTDEVRTVTTNHVENQWGKMKPDMVFRDDQQHLESYMAKHQYFRTRLQDSDTTFLPPTLENWFGCFFTDLHEYFPC